ncbi:MAG: hypothetical protein ABI758_03600 [Candidatus Woesebacteria bacterium]
MKLRFLAVLSVLVGGSLWLWSFTQTDPNLYYSSNNLWVNFQQMMWQIPRATTAWWYVVMIFLSLVLYLSTVQKRSKTIMISACIGVLFLILSNNALSHDLYNYMFNAKAVAVYHQDPHVKSALEIAPQDEWVRFMHNVHTPAPYGRFWTYFSLIPYLAGFGKFLTTYVSFKLFMLLGFAILVWMQRQLHPKNLVLFILNPLVLIETFMNGHNDVWMMALALASFVLILKTKKTLSWQTLVSFILLILSTQVKFATALLLPLWIGLAVGKFEWIKKYWPEIATILLFLPLFTDRSQQFNPWYLIWPLTFLPFITVKYVKIMLITFTLTSLLRYVPFLLLGEYTDTIQFQMRLITWSAIPIATGIWLVARKKIWR